MKIEFGDIPKISVGFRVQWEEAQDAHVILYPEGMIQLNPSAAEVFTRIDGKKNIEEIIKELKEKYPQAEELEEDIFELLKDAREKQWIRFE